MMFLSAITTSAQDKSPEDLTISFKGMMPQGLVGNGKSNVTVDHDGFVTDRMGRHGRPKNGRKPAVPQKLLFSAGSSTFDLSVKKGDGDMPLDAPTTMNS